MITGAAAALVGDALFVGHRARHRIARAPTPSLGTQVITDIDDTVKSSGGIALAGIPLGGVDTSVTRNSFYPGVFQFGLEVAMASARFGSLPEPMAILTARAREFKWALEIKQSSKLCTSYRMAGEERGLAGWGVGPVLYGSVQEWICQVLPLWCKRRAYRGESLACGCGAIKACDGRRRERGGASSRTSSYCRRWQTKRRSTFSSATTARRRR
jgi:hypothetical protein